MLQYFFRDLGDVRALYLDCEDGRRLKVPAYDTFLPALR